MKTLPISKFESIQDDMVWKSLSNLKNKFAFTEQECMNLMGGMARSTYYKGIKYFKGSLNRDQKERVSYLLGIYKALRILFSDGQQAMSWINRKNDLHPFNGITPKEYMMEGSLVRLAEVRRLLDFWRGY